MVSVSCTQTPFGDPGGVRLVADVGRVFGQVVLIDVNVNGHVFILWRLVFKENFFE